MITTKCICGEAIEAPESYVNQRTLCPVCETKLRFVSAERLADGAGAADFDARLLIMSGPAGEGEQLFLGGVHEIAIGRDDSCQIRLPSSAVAGQHCKLVRMDFGPSRWRLVAEEMDALVLANGHHVAERELKDGDAIVIGDFKFQFASILQEPVALVPNEPAVESLGPTCPSCRRKLPNRASICIHCGINIITGKPIVMSKGLDEEVIADRSYQVLRYVSFVMPLGILPIASEAFGTRKPTSTWVIAAITIFTSLIFLIAMQPDHPSAVTLNFMNWDGSREVSMQKLAEIQPQIDPDQNWARPASGELPRIRPTSYPPETLHKLIEVAPLIIYPATVGFHFYQLLTCALLHEPHLLLPFVFHLGGNLLFFFVFGLRINELIGNTKMAIVYPLLAILSATVDHIAHLHSPMQPELGASGAIMGLAGMYLILFPVQRVHMAAWIRFLPIPGLRCLYTTWTMRGFWLLVLWVAWHDLRPMIFGTHDSVGHWAHIGGFISGVAIATALLVTRSINAKGSDIFSVTLGKRAWGIVGRPQHWHA